LNRLSFCYFRNQNEEAFAFVSHISVHKLRSRRLSGRANLVQTPSFSKSFSHRYDLFVQAYSLLVKLSGLCFDFCEVWSS
jgi:hypothetical protein